MEREGCPPAVRGAGPSAPAVPSLGRKLRVGRTQEPVRPLSCGGSVWWVCQDPAVHEEQDQAVQE
jgi:hypothetical protein